MPFEKEGGKGRHPTQKPVALFEYLIKMYSNPGEVVLDPFMGSGTTAVAALKAGRSFVGFETQREYYDASLQRMRELREVLKYTEP